MALKSRASKISRNKVIKNHAGIYLLDAMSKVTFGSIFGYILGKVTINKFLEIKNPE